MNDLKLYDLKELSVMLANVDRTIVSLLARRMALSLQVFAFKKDQVLKKIQASGGNLPENEKIIEIIRPDKEIERVDLAAQWAEMVGLNPLFARGIMYEIINESCKVQLAEMQTGRVDMRSRGHKTSDEWYQDLKTSLLALTNLVAADYDRVYLEEASFAVAAYRRFEYWVIKEILDRLPSNSLALDLGCATGPMSFYLAQSFDRVIGYDLSPAMIKKAQEKKQALGINNLEFTVADIEEGLPLPDGVASLVVLNQGVASDIRHLKAVLKEVERVLRPRGKVFLSFYNREALLYQFDFIPWPVGLLAEINFKARCLEVHVPGQERFLIYAKGYNLEEVEELFQGKLTVENIFSFPTISSILPEHLLANDKIGQDLEAIERSLADSTFGSYLIAVGVK